MTRINKYGEIEDTTCSGCGNPIKMEWVACPHCGKALSSNCPKCQKPLKPEWKACPDCGQPHGRESTMMDDSKPRTTELALTSAILSLNEPIAEECTIDDFMKVDFRVAKVAKASVVEGSDKLLSLELDLGNLTRHVFVGIAKAYKPKDIVGRLVVYVANLKPRKMKFGLTEGMVCVSGLGGSEIFLLSPDAGAKPGQRIH